MTSIKYHRTPKITKLDGRFKLYNRGFKYRVSFNTQNEYSAYSNALKWLENTYGPEYTWNVQNTWSKKIWNHYWQVNTPATNKFWRDVYLREEQDVTMMMLAAV